MQFYKVEAARRATSAKKTIVIFQDRGRPQSNINRKDNRDCSKSKLWPINIDLQIEFGDIFYAILNYFDPCVSLDPSKLSRNLKIWLKYAKHMLQIPNLGGGDIKKTERTTPQPCVITAKINGFFALSLLHFLY